MRRAIACGLAGWLVTASLLVSTSSPFLPKMVPHLATPLSRRWNGELPPLVTISSRRHPFRRSISPRDRRRQLLFQLLHRPTSHWLDWIASELHRRHDHCRLQGRGDRPRRVLSRDGGCPSTIGLAATSSTSNQQAALMFSRNNQISHSPRRVGRVTPPRARKPRAARTSRSAPTASAQSMRT